MFFTREREQRERSQAEGRKGVKSCKEVLT